MDNISYTDGHMLKVYTHSQSVFASNCRKTKFRELNKVYNVLSGVLNALEYRTLTATCIHDSCTCIYSMADCVQEH